MRSWSVNVPSSAVSSDGGRISTCRSSSSPSFGVIVSDGSAFDDRLGNCKAGAAVPPGVCPFVGPGTTRVT